MKKYDQIHETVLKDIFDIYNGIKGLADGELDDLIAKHKSRTRSMKSIARTSNDLICVFPVLASRAISIDNQAATSKAIEKNCVAMLQMLFSAIQLTDADNAFDYIKTFHTNINKSAKAFDLDDIIQVADTIGITDSAIQVGANVDLGILEQVKRDMRNLNFYLEDSVSTKSIAEGFSCKLDPNGQYIVQVETRQMMREADDPNYDLITDYNTSESPEVAHLRNQITKLGGMNDALRREINRVERKSDEDLKRAKNDYKRLEKNYEAIGKAYMDSEKKHRSDYAKQGIELKRTQDELKSLNSRDINIKRAKDLADINKSYIQSKKDQAEFFNKQVLNTEYKKANELMPTLMVINFKSRVGDNYEVIDSVVIGVKAKLYPIGSDDMITHLVAKAKDANWIQKFIKASTREISFFKDFLFAIDKAKIDALSLSKKGSANKMWKVLERRAIKSKWNRLMNTSNDATAITTLMISQNEVDYIRKEFQIDITDVHNTRILMEAYNLLGICVVDESLELSKFMWDTGEDMWETISFNNLERESNDNTYKKVVNLLTKVM